MSEVKRAPIIHIVGAGFSGLICAYAAVKLGHKVIIYEKSSRCGGLLGSEPVEGLGLCEASANALINSFEAEDLFEDLGIEALSPLPDSKNRYLLRRKMAQRWPLSWLESLSMGFHVFTHFWAIKPRKHEKISDWSLRFFGDAATRHVVIPALQGIYGRDPSSLSANLVLNRFFKRNPRRAEFKKRKLKTRFSVAPRGGMGELVARLESRLRSHAVEFRMEHTFSSAELGAILDHKEKVIIATPLYVSTELVKDILPGFYEPARSVQYVDLLSATVFFDKSAEWLPGFGILFPRHERHEALGVLFNHQIFEGRVENENTISETWLYKDELLNLNDEQLLALLLKERSILTGKKVVANGSRIYRGKRAIPYYDIALERLLEQEAFLNSKAKGIAFASNWVGALSLGRMLSQHMRMTEDFIKEPLQSVTPT